MSQVGSRRLEPPTAIPNAACPSDLGSDTLCGTDFGYDALTSEVVCPPRSGPPIGLDLALF